MPEDSSDNDPRDNDPFEEWRKRMEEDPFLGPFFEDLDREFERMRESLSRMLEDMEEGDLDPGSDPFVYGFSVSMGPEGQPEFDEFGTTGAGPAGQPGPETFDETRQPLVDVHEGRDGISITAELPGVEKSDINLRAKEREIVVDVDDPDQPFFKRIELPAPVDPSTTQATYKNGVLDVEVDKLPDPDEGTEVSID